MFRWFKLVMLVVMASVALVGCGASSSDAGNPGRMTVAELKQALDTQQNLFLLDVRTPQEFSQDGRVSQATLIPLDELPTRINELPTDTPIACICRSGNRSNTACGFLAEQGFQVTDVLGGMNAWKAAGYPTE